MFMISMKTSKFQISNFILLFITLYIIIYFYLLSFKNYNIFGTLEQLIKDVFILLYNE